jgi:hypothetical protein
MMGNSNEDAAILLRRINDRIAKEARSIEEARGVLFEECGPLDYESRQVMNFLFEAVLLMGTLQTVSKRPDGRRASDR